MLSISQKSLEVLRFIKLSLAGEEISSTIHLMSDRTHYLRVSRVNDVIRMIAKMRLVVKHRQAKAVAGYLTGQLTGNQLLLILQR